MNKGLFLDRDGVVNREIGYLHRIEDVEFVPGIFEVGRFFQDHGYGLFIVTNQAGVARGLYTEEDVSRLHRWMVEQFAQRAVRIAQIYFCPHHPTEGNGPYRVKCDCRKPAPGMILQAQRDHGIDLARSVLVGDKESDILAGLNAGIATNVLYRNGQATGGDTRASVVIEQLGDLMHHVAPL